MKIIEQKRWEEPRELPTIEELFDEFDRIFGPRVLKELQQASARGEPGQDYSPDDSRISARASS
jgi:hypothetical protein